jgi:hypothetical protein
MAEMRTFPGTITDYQVNMFLTFVIDDYPA